MLKRLRRHREEERGAALIWIAGTLVVLLSMAACATDLGWILLWNSRLQAAADAAALAGVVNLPGDPAQARIDAEIAAGANRFPVPTRASLTPQVIAENQYRVTLDTEVDTFFLRLIGFDTFHLSQSAHAQYVKPVRLGSPDNQFGGPPNAFWAAINGRYTEHHQGDPYASLCVTHAESSPGCVGATNPQYREEGYYYAIEVAPGSNTLHVEFFDGGHYAEPAPPPPPPPIVPPAAYADGTSLTGDSSWRWTWPEGQRGVYLEYNLFSPDTTPTDPTDNSALECSGKFPVNDDASDGNKNKWEGPNNCTVGGPLTPGVWVLQLPSPLYEGSTKFGIRASVDTGQRPRVFGLLDMSIYVNLNGGQANPYLAEIRPEHEGKKLELDIWDLGDNDGEASLQIRPPSSIGTWACRYGGVRVPGQPLPSSSGDCLIDISDRKYNAEWLYIDIDLTTYSCDLADNGCWWTARILNAGQAHDRTTWTARVSGDPVSLVD